MSLNILGARARPGPTAPTAEDAEADPGDGGSAVPAQPVTAAGLASAQFRGPALWARVAPFAILAVLAEVSLVLPPGIRSLPAALVSVVLLLAAAGEFLLPWPRLPSWMTVLVPLTYTGSVLALVLAAGASSAVGIVILIPLIWTALFHRPWESACIVPAVVAVELIESLTPVPSADAVTVRRVILWGGLGALISVATHGLRERIRRSQERTAQLQSRLRELTVLADRDRIAADLRDNVIQQMFGAGLTLQGAASMTSNRDVRQRIATSVEEIDKAIRTLRDAIYGLERRPEERGLRQEVMDLCSGLSPAPEISFTGAVDGAMLLRTRDFVVGLLREALGPVREHGVPARISLAVGGNSCLAMVEAAPVPAAAQRAWSAEDFSALRDRAAEHGVRVDVVPIPGGTRLRWHIPLDPPRP
ncbi:MAG TPA: histidine kinase [Streptosporangiaceae bacterium]|nr:histidine kinase [Streptosporangiaceae bacterium]